MLSFWIFIFVVSLLLLVKGSDWFLAGAEKIGLATGLSPFIVGIAIVGVGTSLPELASAFAAILGGVTEIIPANAIGSNIANILLVVGVSAILGRRLAVDKDLIDLDIPLLTASTVLLLGILWDKQVIFYEAVILVVMYIVYLAYTATHGRKKRGKKDDLIRSVLPSRAERRRLILASRRVITEKIKVIWKDLLMLIIGGVALVLGAKYLIDSVIELSKILNVGAGVISIVAIAFGTSLPELFVSGRAALNKKYEVALGTVFGSNVFNALVVIGIPGLFANLRVDEQTFSVGLPALVIATFMFIISGISRRIHMWEGFFYVSVYVLFIVKILGLF